LKEAAETLNLLDSVEEPLKVVDPPYLPPVSNTESPYTLVLDLDETLIHFAEVNSLITNRLNKMSKYL